MSLTILGTSHIAKQSIREITKAVEEGKPDFVALELDAQRAYSLLHEEKRNIPLAAIFQIGVKGYLFAKIGQFVQRKVGKIVGIMPGADMKTGLMLAKKEKLKVALIDQPIQITLRKFSKTLTWREKLRFAGDIVKGIFQPRKQISALGLETLDLNKVPKDELIEKMMEQLKSRYPSIYKVLVADRNKYMVRKLVKLMQSHPEKKILAVVGAGHKKGMEELLLKVDVVK